MRFKAALVSVLPVIVGLVAATSGCSAHKPAAAAPASSGAAEKVPDNADAVAKEAVAARVTMLLHLGRLQGFRFSNRLMVLGGWDEALAGTGVEPFRDVTRAFIAAHGSHNGQVGILLQHTAPENEVANALAALQQKWVSAHPEPPPVTDPELPDLSRFPFPAAYRYMKNDFAHVDGAVLIAAPHPGLIAVLPPERAFAAFRLMEAGGLPAPEGREAMVFRAWDPGSSIQGGPAWSTDVRFAEAVFTFDAAGNSTLRFRAVCTSAEAAKTQAEVMTSQVENAQTLSLGGAKLRLFDYIEFHAKNDRVHMLTHLFADDVDWIVAMSMK